MLYSQQRKLTNIIFILAFYHLIKPSVAILLHQKRKTMNTLTGIHAEHRELISDIRFLKKQISFVLSLIKKAYTETSNKDNTKLLDAYEESFDGYRSTLDELLLRLAAHERLLFRLYKDDLIDLEKTKLKDEKDIIATYYKTLKKFRSMKDSFYNFIMEIPSVLAHTKENN